MSGNDLSASIEKALDLLAATRASATFFVLGEDAGKVRLALQRCIREGHEVACHGMLHRRVDRLGAGRFRRDLTTSLAVIEDITQVACRGYRAPWFSISKNMAWFFDILAEAGVEYDSSLWAPLGSKDYERPESCGVVEVPIRFVRIGAARVGILGGLSLRLLPRMVISRLFRRCETVHQPACVYIHPYEWMAAAGPGMPFRMSGLRRNLCVSSTLPRLSWLAGTWHLTSIAKWRAAD